VTSIAAIGHLSRDVVADAAPRPGGPVLYAARALAAAGADARISASCAREHREELLPELEALGLPLRWFESSATTAYSFHYEGDRRIMQQNGVGDPWSPAQALEAADDAGWVHVGALVRGDFSADTLAALAAGGRRLLLDAQGLVRARAIGPLRLEGSLSGELDHVAILKIDEQEALTLTGSADPVALEALGVPEVLLTLGSRGSYVLVDGTLERIPAPQLAEPVDPTGAGDTFAATYLAARAGGHRPVESAHEATAAVAAFLEAR
jgi:sugar/nucleoside kinase (ribokinase family)